MAQATTTYCIKNTTAVWNLTPPPADLRTNTSTACDTPSIKVDITDIRYHSVKLLESLLALDSM